MTASKIIKYAITEDVLTRCLHPLILARSANGDDTRRMEISRISDSGLQIKVWDDERYQPRYFELKVIEHL